MKLVSILILTVCTAGLALAQSDVTWVASTGTNNAFCFRTDPCATFAGALAVTNANGVIKTVDAAEYGVVTITKNVSIDCNGGGGGAAINAGTSSGIVINNPGGQVTIRNLTIRVASGGDGIDITGGDAHLENVLIVGAPSYGVYANVSANPVHVTTKNVTVMNASNVGILLSGASGSLRDSVIRGGNYGVFVQSFAGHAADALVERCELSYNSIGLYTNNNGSGAGATARVSDTVITGNANGIFANGGQIISFRTNMLAGNTNDGTTPFSVSLK